jgi:hypothetical protein
MLSVFQAVVGLLVTRPQLEARPTRQSYGNQRLRRQLEGAPDDGHNSARNMLSDLYSFSVHVVTYKLCHQLHALFYFFITITFKNSYIKMSVTQITLNINIKH